MTEEIREQLVLFCMSAYMGAVMAFAYDFIRILRNVKKYKTVWIWIQDIVYWICFGYVFYMLLLKYNFGGIRAYTYLGILIGMAVYFLTLSRLFVKYASILILKVANTLLKILKLASKPIKLIINKFNQTIGKKMSEWHIEQKVKRQQEKEERKHRKEEHLRQEGRHRKGKHLRQEERRRKGRHLIQEEQPQGVSVREAGREERMTTEL